MGAPTRANGCTHKKYDLYVKMKVPLIVQWVLFLVGCVVAALGFTWIVYATIKVIEYKHQPIKVRTDDGTDISF
jgi:hypothetical protein